MGASLEWTTVGWRCGGFRTRSKRGQHPTHSNSSQNDSFSAKCNVPGRKILLAEKHIYYIYNIFIYIHIYYIYNIYAR